MKHKTQYAVIQHYYDKGQPTAQILPVHDWKEGKREYAHYDEYIDIFDTIEEAQQFKQDVLNA